MAEVDVRSQAIRLAEMLSEAWNEDLIDSSDEIDAMTGLALAHAVAQGWIEPDPSMTQYFASAEDLLAVGGGADVDDE
jgi:hypothetical protein